MIAPTPMAIALAAFGAPLALLIAAIAPGLWPVGAAWIALVGGMMLVDALVRVAFADRGPRAIDLAIATNDLVAAEADHVQIALTAPACEARFRLRLQRRGHGAITRAFVRWRGPMGLVARHTNADLVALIAIAPDMTSVERQAERLFSRTDSAGLKPLRDRGEGSEFDALVEYQPGRDRRLVDWKQSARHTRLLLKEVRAERNHQIVLAFDTGRLMCEPASGLARIDWALNAGLILAYVGLKLGDRIGVFAFDARPHLASGFVTGARAFTHVKLLTAAIDYSTEETNFTLGLTALAAHLQRRSMVVIFTDFADTISAELMLENLGRLMRRHLVVFVAFRDDELEGMRSGEPHAVADVSRAVIADRMLREREIVLARLRRLGAHIVEAPAAHIGPALIQAYDLLRRRERV